MICETGYFFLGGYAIGWGVLVGLQYLIPNHFLPTLLAAYWHTIIH